MHNEKARRDRDATSNSHLLVDEEQGRWACCRSDTRRRTVVCCRSDMTRSPVVCYRSEKRRSRRWWPAAGWRQGDPVNGGLLQVGDEEIRS
jgi:hypothetical protein